MTDREETDPVAIASFFDRMQAEVALSVLRAAGIEGHIDQPFLSSPTRLRTA